MKTFLILAGLHAASLIIFAVDGSAITRAAVITTGFAYGIFTLVAIAIGMIREFKNALKF